MTVLVGSLVGGVVIFGGVTVDTGLVGGGDALDVKNEFAKCMLHRLFLRFW